MNWLSDESMERLRQVIREVDFSGTKYRSIRELGRGGMATVYLALDQDLERHVALKVLDLPDASGELVKRMWCEAKIMAQLEHPGIVPIHDVGVLPEDRVFFAMKYVDGKRLSDVQGEDLPARLRMFQKICDAVAFAHAQGIIHRDLKPQNIMVGNFGEVLVLDWGLAKALGETVDSSGTDQGNPDKTLTGHGQILGTPAYMAPEQAEGNPTLIDERTDVYALGAILYFILTGAAPFEAATISSVRQHFHEVSLVLPRKKNPAISKPLEAICIKAMSQSKEQRYADAKELRDDVIRYLDGLSVTAYRESFFETAQRWLSRNYFVVLLVLTYLIVRVLILIFARR